METQRFPTDMAARARAITPNSPSQLSVDTRARRRGQSLVEFAVVLPMLLLLLGGAIDLGRAFFARIAVENATKEGVLFGATRPNCDDAGAGCADPFNVEWHIRKDLGDATISWTAECLRAGAPVALADCEPDDLYRVVVNQTFPLVTPLLSGLFGSGVELSASATAVVFSDAMGPAGPTPSGSPAPTPSAAPGECLVPDLVGLRANDVDDPWDDRGFTGAITKNGSGNFTVMGQSLVAGTFQPCTSAITISATAMTPVPTPSPTPTATPSPTPTATPSPTPFPTPTPSPACKFVPTLEGFTVAAARTQWTTAGFTGAFTPGSGQNNKTVLTQTTNPSSVPGECRPPTTTVTVTYGN